MQRPGYAGISMNTQEFYFIFTNRIKEHTFANKKLTFALPRPLTLLDVSLRALFTTFDMYSPRSKTYACRIKREKFEFDPIPEIIIEREATEIESEKTENAAIDEDSMPPELKALMDLSESTIKKVRFISVYFDAK